MQFILQKRLIFKTDFVQVIWKLDNFYIFFFENKKTSRGKR